MVTTLANLLKTSDKTHLRPPSSTDICLARNTKSLQAVYAVTKAGRLLPLYVLTFIPLRAGATKFTVLLIHEGKCKIYRNGDDILCFGSTREAS